MYNGSRASFFSNPHSFFFSKNPALKNISASVEDKKARLCVQTVNSAARAGQQRADLPLLFWECVDCMTHALMYLSVSAPAIQPAAISGQRKRKRERSRETRLQTITQDAE